MAARGAKGPYEPITIGADIGNATTTIAGPDGVTTFFPSFVSTFEIGPYDGMPKIATSRHHITYGGAHALVGMDALETSGADTLLREFDQADAWRRYVAPEALYCLLAGISAAYLDADCLGVRLATGAPLSIYQTHAEAIRQRFLGEHSYHYNGHARKVVIEDVQVYGEGREVLRLLPPAQRAGRVAVHDLGGRTWNVLLFKDGALVGFRTYDLGVERLIDKVTSISMDVGARWQLLQELRRDPKAHEEHRAAIEAKAEGALAVIEGKVRIDKAERHLLAGGGAPLLEAPLRRRYGAPTQKLNGKAPEGANAAAYRLAASEAA